MTDLCYQYFAIHCVYLPHYSQICEVRTMLCIGYLRECSETQNSQHV